MHQQHMYHYKLILELKKRGGGGLNQSYFLQEGAALFQ